MSRVFANASSNFISLPTTVYSPTAPFTMAAWCLATLTPPAIESIFHFIGSSPQVYIRCPMGGLTPTFQYYDGSAFHGGNFSSALTIGTWAQLTGTYDGTTYISYFNGTSASYADASGPAFTTTGINIGNDPTGPSRAWTGSLADVAIWNVALKAGEVGALAKGARPSTIRPLALKGYWPLDGLQNPEPDLSGNGNNGTLTNAPTLGAGPPVMMFTPRWPRSQLLGGVFLPPSAGEADALFTAGAVAPANLIAFRRSLSSLGTRTGSRQAVQ